MKKKITLTLLALVSALCCALGLAACDDGDKSDRGTQTVAVESVTLNETTLTLDIGNEETLTATVTPDNATNKTITWSSSAPTVATVSNGKVTAKAVGSAIITATAGEKSATCFVTVNSATQTVAVESVTFNKDELTLNIGDEETLTATVAPDNATHKAVIWSSSAPAIASVDSAGKVTAKAEGTATITATTANSKTATCAVTVNASAPTAEVTANEWATALSYAAFTNVTVNSSYLDEGTWLAKTDLVHGAVYSFEDDGDGYTDERFYSKEESTYYLYENESGQYIKTENKSIETDEELLQNAFPEYFCWYIEAFAESYSQFTFNGTDTYVATDYIGDNGDLELHSVKLKFENGKLVLLEVQVESNDPNSIVTATTSHYGSTTVSLPANFVEDGGESITTGTF